MNNKAFTLVELLVAITILAILTLIAIPTIRSFQNNNSKSQFLNYREAVETSGKLYIDSYGYDLFGEAPYGCQIIKLSELVNKKIAKDISLKDASCNINTNNSFIVVRKYNNEYSYNSYLYCEDEKGSERYSNMDEGIGVCENENTGPEVKTSIEENKDKNSKSKSVKVILKDEYGFTANQSFEYVWTTKSNVSSLTDSDFAGAKKYNYNNKSIKTTGTPVELVSKSITMPNFGADEKEYYLAIRPIKVQNIVNLSNTELKLVGPFRYDKKPPECPSVKVLDQDKKDLGSSGAAKSLEYNLTFSGNDFYNYDLVYNIDGKDQDKITNQTATKLTPSSDGKYILKLTIRDYAGNENSCTIGNYTKDTVKPNCGTTSGASTSWTNNNRKITQRCTDETSGCAKSSYETTYKTTTKTAKITIADNAGNTRDCSYNVYVDKTAPTVKVGNMRGTGGGTSVSSSDCYGNNWVAGSCSSSFRATWEWSYESNFSCSDAESGCTSNWEIIWNHGGTNGSKCGTENPRSYVSESSCGWHCGGQRCSWSHEYHRIKDKAGNYGEVILYNSVTYG